MALKRGLSLASQQVEHHRERTTSAEPNDDHQVEPPVGLDARAHVAVAEHVEIVRPPGVLRVRPPIVSSPGKDVNFLSVSPLSGTWRSR
ncbi:MAG: hypothetical protein V3V08_09510 [Nannocystaceae bacterium]